jgi:hypothetical protein
MEPSSGERTRAPKEWEGVGEFQDGGYYVKINRAKGTRSFSLEVGGLKTDGTTMRFVPLPWRLDGETFVIDERFEPAKVCALILRARTLVIETLTKEGIPSKRR